MAYRFQHRLFQISCAVGLGALIVIGQGRSLATGSFSQTATYTATATPFPIRPSLTYTPSITFTPTPSQALVVASREQPIRNGPGLEFAIVGTMEPDVALPFYVMSDDGNWVLLSQPGEPGRWLGLSPFVHLEGEWNEIPVMGASPMPTNTQTPTPTVTASYTPIPTVDVNAIAATVESAVLATLSAQGIGGSDAQAQALAPGAHVEMSADDDPGLGSEDAPVVIIEFGDLRDPYGKRFFDETLPKILDTYGDKVRLVYRDYPILGSLSVQAAIAAECADKQNAYWDYQRKILDQGSALISDMLVQFARDLDLEMGAFATCQRDPLVFAEVDKDRLDAEAVGINGVPTFFINGEVVVGSQPYEFFAPVIDAALEKASMGG